MLAETARSLCCYPSELTARYVVIDEDFRLLGPTAGSGAQACVVGQACSVTFTGVGED